MARPSIKFRHTPKETATRRRLGRTLKGDCVTEVEAVPVRLGVPVVLAELEVLAVEEEEAVLVDVVEGSTPLDREGVTAGVPLGEPEPEPVPDEVREEEGVPEPEAEGVPVREGVGVGAKSVTAYFCTSSMLSGMLPTMTRSPL